MKKISTDLIQRIVFFAGIVPGKTVRLILIMLLLVSGLSMQAQEKTITLYMEGVSLSHILKAIRDQSGKNIVFSNDLVAPYQDEMIRLENATTEEALEQCLANKPFTFRIEGGIIIIEPQEEEQGSQLRQTVRGTVLDKESLIPLPGANVIIRTRHRLIGGISDESGKFRLEGVPVGRHTLQITYVGYKDIQLPEIYVGSAREVILDIELVENVQDIEAVEVRPYAKGEPMNDMAVVSARSFSVEETRRYAGAASDPGRMALSFAGVNTDDDLSNQIVVRGNSPNGMLWRMEGVQIPVPNHFYQEGYDAGYVSVLSADMLGNSDFFTGAFPAEYGNGTAGVFDMSLRNGNNQQREYSVEIGSMGADIALEGPFSKNYNGSYLINGRYATFAILNMIGVKIDGDLLPEYSDLSYKFFLPTRKAGTFSIWGLGGISKVFDEPVADSSLWDMYDMKYGYSTRAKTGSTGITHKIFPDEKSFIRTSLAFTGYTSSDSSYTLNRDYQREYDYGEFFSSSAIRFSTSYNRKFTARTTVKTGMELSKQYFEYNSLYLDETTRQWINDINGKGNTEIVQGYLQMKHKFSDEFQVNAGLHYMHFAMNGEHSFEPRLGLRWNFQPSQSLNLGFGKHSKHELLMRYSIMSEVGEDSMAYANPDLKLNKAYHIVLGYTKHFNHDIRFMTEIYYQHLFDLPVARDSSKTYSSINDDFFGMPMISEGIGRNYGIEFTLEKYFVDSYYFLFTLALYNAEYKPLDGNWYNSRYNNNHIMNLTGGKEFTVRNKNTLGVNMRFLWSGGKRDTPIETDEDPETGVIWYFDQKKINSIQYEDYLRLDLGISYTINNPKVAHEFSVDIQNVTARENVSGKSYDPETGFTYVSTMTGILPFINYKLRF